MHKLQAGLHNQLRAAAQQIQVGGLYAHYKNPDQLYKIVDLAVTEWDDNICVIYQAQYGEQITFVRTLDSWLETVMWQGREVPRFTLASN